MRTSHLLSPRLIICPAIAHLFLPEHPRAKCTTAISECERFFLFRSIEVDVLSFTYAVAFYIHGGSASLIDKQCRTLHCRVLMASSWRVSWRRYCPNSDRRQP